MRNKKSTVYTLQSTGKNGSRKSEVGRYHKGQSLMELVVVIAMTIVVVSALVFATIASLRNANLAQNQIQATKLAQQGLERVRSLRDRDGQVDYTRADLTHTEKFSDLWDTTFSCPANCFFFFSSVGILTGGTQANFENVPPNFFRQFQLEEEGSDPKVQKKVTSIVKWSDFSGSHESRLTTVLRRI